MTHAPTYDRFSRWLHWLAAALVVAAWALMEAKDVFPKGSEGRRWLASLHVEAGILVAALLALRLPWRLAHPVAPIAAPHWAMLAATGAKAALYILMAAVPAAGIAAWAARPEGVTLFGLAPGDPAPVLAALRRPLKEIHEVLANALLVVAGAHAAAAIWHHRVLGDATLRRMLGRP